MRPKKSLGQNFLNSSTVVSRIITAGRIMSGETVIEIGPGKGVLTKALLSVGARVIAIEKDDRLVPVLREMFAEDIARESLTLIHGDIVDLLDSTIPGTTESYKVVANIPYYITGLILRGFLERAHKPSAMILMLQHEVAQRIVARDGKESILSLSVKAYGVPRIVCKVPSRYFSPPPRVDSAVLAIEGIKGDMFENRAHEERFFEIIKLAFAQKRKKISGTLRARWGSETISRLSTCGLDPHARPEDILLESWVALARA